MSVFVDTSAFLAVLDGDDRNHPKAVKTWTRLLENGAVLFTSNYVLLESFALIQNRLGMKALKVFHDDVASQARMILVDEAAHQSAVSGVLAADRRALSLVDCASFDVMRRNGIRESFAFDRHFSEQGFAVLN